MSRRAVAMAVALLLVPASAGANGKLSMRGDAALGYRRDDRFAEGADPGDTGELDWYARMWATGVPFRPGLLQWLLSARYGTVYTHAGDSSSRQRELTFRAAATGLQQTRYPVSLSASRRWTDFLIDSDNERTGSTLETSLSGSGTVRSKRLPNVSANVSTSGVENHTIDGRESSGRSTRLGVGASQGIPGGAYALRYDTSWDSGTYVESNYRSHHVLLDYAGDIPGQDAEFRLNERYYLRRPTNEAPTNPRYDDNRFGTGVDWRPNDRTFSSTRYQYSRFLLTALGDPEKEDIRHRLATGVHYRKSEEWSYSGSFGFGYQSQRRDDMLEQVAGNSLGGGFLWTKTTDNGITYRAGAGGDIGLSAPGPDLASGVTGTAGFFTERETFGASASYTGSVRGGFAGEGGWTIDQQLNVTGERLWGRYRWLRGSLLAVTSRRESDLLGSFASRSVLLLLHGRRDRYNGRLHLGFSDGLADELTGPGGDGLFLPVEFNTHSYFASFSTQRELLGRQLSARMVARSVYSQAPERDAEWQHGAGVTLVYRLGLVRMFLDERFTIGGGEGGWRANNTIMLRLARAFGGNR